MHRSQAKCATTRRSPSTSPRKVPRTKRKRFMAHRQDRGDTQRTHMRRTNSRDTRGATKPPQSLTQPP